MSLLAVAVRGVTRGKLRPMLTGLAVAVGIFSVFIISSVGSSGKSAIIDSLRGIGAGGVMISRSDMPSSESFDRAIAEKLSAQCDTVIDAMPFVIRYAAVKAGDMSDTVVVWGVGENVADFASVNILYGRIPTRSEVSSSAKVAVIGENAAKSMFGRSRAVGRKAKLTINGHSAEFLIVGVTGESDGLALSSVDAVPAFIYVPYTVLSGQFGCAVNRMILSVAEGADTETVTRETIRFLRSELGPGRSYEVSDLDSDLGAVESVADILTALLSVTAAVSLLVAGIGVMNTMLTSVTERRKEIGIAKAIGARDGQIALTFLAEAVIITVIGALIGTAAGLLISLPVIGALGFTPSFDWRLVGISVGLTIVTGLLFGVFPAVRAARTDPIIALRDE